MDNTRRFSGRVADYVRYRPAYPRALLEFMRGGLGLRPHHLIADVGSGTGIFARLLLENGNQVLGVEPNREMREAAQRELRAFTGFKSIDASAEQTTVAAKSVDFITSAQAFHWFDARRACVEFRRILRSGGQALLVWNNRKETGGRFAVEYERALERFGVDYLRLKHSSPEKRAGIDVLFAPGGCRLFRCSNAQSFDLIGLKGRCLSSSYAPKPDHPNHVPLMVELEALFARHSRDGTVVFEYETEAYYGALTS